METTTLPSVGDSVVWNCQGRKISAKVAAMFATTQTNAGGVRLRDASGTEYSFHPETWMTKVMSGEIALASA